MANYKRTMSRDLCLAISCQDPSRPRSDIDRLLDSGTDINAVDGTFGTALGVAAYKGNVEIVSLLLDRGADINAVCGWYGTALGAAACGGNEGVVSLLLDRGADINMEGGNFGTVLGSAVYGEKEEIVSLLLDRGAVLNTVGNKNETVLGLAVSGRNEKILSLLLNRGADINAVGGWYGTALGTAAYEGKAEIVSLLLDRGADINTVGNRNQTVLGMAVSGGNEKIMSLLLDRGADINAVGGDFGTALGAAVYGGKEEIVSLLLDRGADIKAALCEAAYKGEEKVVSLLLERGADINAIGGKYGTALCAAAYKGREQIVTLLLERGADINAVGGKYGTALAAAAYKGKQQILSLLLDRRADTNAMGGDYGTALAAAAFKGRTDIVSLLLDHGADVIRVGGCYSAAFGMYPSALDVAHSEDSKADQALIAQLKTASQKQNGPSNQPTNPDADPVKNVFSRPPFPMPYMPPNLSSLDIFPTEFRTGDNITPEQADIPCRNFNEEVLSQSLTALVGLHEYTARTRCQWIQNDVRYFLACNFDFGLAYAAARIAWKGFNDHSIHSIIATQRSRWHKHAQTLDKMRSEAIHSDSGQELIKLPYSIMPRRLWDLKSNRVVKFQMLHAAQPTITTPPTFWAVSHSWTSDMSTTWTAINQHEWPVPLPKDITLDYLRSELLTLGAEYVWLDVVCLRQQSNVNHFERLRKEEWRLDVPTIGNVYRAAAKIVRYFNGLGVRFSNDGWDDPKHWLQRAWTLQEIAAESTTINGGITRGRGQILLNSQGKVGGKVITLRDAIDPVIILAAQVDSSHGCEVYELAREMSRRYATMPVDKISGLFYLLRTTKLPCYDEKMTSEDFWTQCFHLLPVERKAEILFDFPYRGSDTQWFPTWAQMLDWPARNLSFHHMRSPGSLDSMSNIPREASFCYRNLWTVPHAALNQTDNPGEYEVTVGNRLFGFYLPYRSQKPINVQGKHVFTLAIAIAKLEDAHAHAYNWVVCKAVGKRIGAELGLVGVAEVNVLKKVGVIRTDACSELLVGGKNGASLFHKMDCLFV